MSGQNESRIRPSGRAAVVVLGDIGRSPRMQYHALSLARQAHLEVDIVAYGGSDPHSAVKEHKSIHINEMTQWPSNPRSFPKILHPLLLILKPLVQFFMLLWYLCVKIPKPDVFIVQAMQHELAQNWGISATVLYDQPPDFFQPASLEEKHKLFCGIDKSLRTPYSLQDCLSNEVLTPEDDNPNVTLFTTQTGTDISLKWNRPALIVSSTSWTPDEDFNILLEAALMYDRRVSALLNEDDLKREDVFWQEIKGGKQYPRLLFIITGKGPEKEKYEQKMAKLNLKRVAFRTMWLEPEDYPLLLGSADLGVCLHTSSSGLDLPMKVVDMFGCGLPVCAVSYSCIHELVEVDKNGLLFSSSSELADQFVTLFKGFPGECDELKSLKQGVLASRSSVNWATEWEANAKPLISKVIFDNSS